MGADRDHSALICDEVDPVLNKILEDGGVAVSYEPEISPERIGEVIGEYDIVVVRSRTTLTGDLIGKAGNCRIIARVGVGWTTSTWTRRRPGGSGWSTRRRGP